MLNINRNTMRKYTIAVKHEGKYNEEMYRKYQPSRKLCIGNVKQEGKYNEEMYCKYKELRKV